MQVMIEQNEVTAAPGLEQVVLESSSIGATTAPDDASVPTRILIAPHGEVHSASGSFVVDDESIDATIAAFEAHGTDLPIDYEHQTLGGSYSSPTGQAPAAGWIKALKRISPGSVSDGNDGVTLEPGLWAEVSWTDEAREKLARREYRYVSPVALVRRSDRRLVGIHSVALTNKPAIMGMRPVVNRDEPAGGSIHAPAAEGADTVVVLAALKEALSLDASAGETSVLTAALQRLQVLAAVEARRRAEDRVATAMSAGKLTAAQRDWALSLAQRDPAEFDRWERSAPLVVPLGRTSPPDLEGAVGSTDRRAVEASARSEWQTSRDFLEKFCTEEAYVANSVREAALL